MADEEKILKKDWAFDDPDEKEKADIDAEDVPKCVHVDLEREEDGILNALESLTSQNPDQHIVLVVGNPGAGKSTILNTLVDTIAFNAGMSTDGTGVTKGLQYFMHEGICYVDTPGLSDPDLTTAANAALAATQALKSNALFKICFVLQLRNGRLLFEELTAIHTILTAIRLEHVPYYCIYNQCKKSDIKVINAKSNKLNELYSFVGYPPEGKLPIKNYDDADGEDGARLPNRDQILAFFQSMHTLHIRPSQVGEVQNLHVAREEMAKLRGDFNAMMDINTANEAKMKILEEAKEKADLARKESQRQQKEREEKYEEDKKRRAEEYRREMARSEDEHRALHQQLIAERKQKEREMENANRQASLTRQRLAKEQAAKAELADALATQKKLQEEAIQKAEKAEKERQKVAATNKLLAQEQAAVAEAMRLEKIESQRVIAQQQAAKDKLEYTLAAQKKLREEERKKQELELERQASLTRKQLREKQCLIAIEQKAKLDLESTLAAAQKKAQEKAIEQEQELQKLLLAQEQAAKAEAASFARLAEQMRAASEQKEQRIAQLEAQEAKRLAAVEAQRRAEEAAAREAKRIEDSKIEAVKWCKFDGYDDCGSYFYYSYYGANAFRKFNCSYTEYSSNKDSYPDKNYGDRHTTCYVLGQSEQSVYMPSGQKMLRPKTKYCLSGYYYSYKARSNSNFRWVKWESGKGMPSPTKILPSQLGERCS